MKARLRAVPKPASNRLFLVTLAIAAGIVGVVLWQSGKVAVPDVERLGFQDADSPLMMPETGGVDPRFHFLSPWQTAQIPTALRFDMPMGSEHGALTYNAQKFQEMNEKRGGPHLGDDLNGIGGTDTDLGDPVFATADGLVLYAGEPSSGWGKVVILGHTDAEGRPLQSMYAHLDRIQVAIGALVPRGGKIGTVGTANGHYPAHLHFEIRTGHGVDIGAGYGPHPLNRLDPTATIAELRGAAADDLSPSPLARAIEPDAAPWTTLEIEGAERLSELED